MKNSIRLLFYLCAFTLLSTGCSMKTRPLTEWYIKTQIEMHEVGEFSTIKTLSIYKGYSSFGGAYIELTGFKYASDAKMLVIGADKYYKARSKFEGDNTIIAEIKYIELSVAQCKQIVGNHKILLNKLKAEKPRVNEEIYHDYTVSNDLFISYRKSAGGPTDTYMNLWIDGEKYRIPTLLLINKLEKFIAY